MFFIKSLMKDLVVGHEIPIFFNMQQNPACFIQRVRSVSAFRL